MGIWILIMTYSHSRKSKCIINQPNTSLHKYAEALESVGDFSIINPYVIHIDINVYDRSPCSYISYCRYWQLSISGDNFQHLSKSLSSTSNVIHFWGIYLLVKKAPHYDKQAYSSCLHQLLNGSINYEIITCILHGYCALSQYSYASSLITEYKEIKKRLHLPNQFHLGMREYSHKYGRIGRQNSVMLSITVWFPTFKRL